MTNPPDCIQTFGCCAVLCAIVWGMRGDLGPVGMCYTNMMLTFSYQLFFFSDLVIQSQRRCRFIHRPPGNLGMLAFSGSGGTPRCWTIASSFCPAKRCLWMALFSHRTSSTQLAYPTQYLPSTRIRFHYAALMFGNGAVQLGCWSFFNISTIMPDR
jgi:hypothetical protein